MRSECSLMCKVKANNNKFIILSLIILSFIISLANIFVFGSLTQFIFALQCVLRKLARKMCVMKIAHKVCTMKKAREMSSVKICIMKIAREICSMKKRAKYVV